MPIFIIPDVIFIHFVLQRRLLALEALLDILSLYACVWVWGLYVTMVERPHSADDGYLVVRRGLLDWAVIDPADIESISQIGVQRGMLGNGFAPDVAYLGVGGEPRVIIRVRNAVTVHTAVGHRSRLSTAIVISTDRPAEFLSVVEKLKASRSEVA